jgi:FixJ family two-component response regulator
MTERESDVYHFRVVRDKTFREIAVLLGISPGAVSIYFYRADEKAKRFSAVSKRMARTCLERAAA